MDAMVVCSNQNPGIGLEIWDLENGVRLRLFPSCCTQSNGLTFLGNRYLVASQVQRTGSVGDGAIFTWPLNMQQGGVRTNNVMEGIAPLSSTRDGIYLAGGGANSGNIYMWEVTSGRLLRKWCAHRKSVTCLVFTQDDSFLVSGSEDGTIGVWPLINLLDERKLDCFPYMFNYWAEHKGAITGLLSASKYFVISSSLDGTCRIWDMVMGKALITRQFSIPVTAIALDIGENMLCCGCENGSIIVSNFDSPIIEHMDSFLAQVTLKGHNKSISALRFCKMGLVSASTDSTACVWDVAGCAVIRQFNDFKGPISNLIVICKSLISKNNNPQSSKPSRVSLFNKYSQSLDLPKQFMTLLPSTDYAESRYRSTKLLASQAPDLQMESTPEALQLKVETNRASQNWEISMTKHLMKINTYIQGSYTDLLHGRFIQDSSQE